jgi:hypothetical protein
MHHVAYPVVAVAPVVGLGVYCVTHLIFARARWGRPPYGPLIAGFFAGFVATLALTLLAAWRAASRDADLVALTVLEVLTYSALGWCYFHFVNLGVASLRIRVLEEIVEAGGSLAADALGRLYDDGVMAENRIRRLHAGGHIVLRNDRFHGGRAAFRGIARAFAVLRWLIIGRGSS